MEVLAKFTGKKQRTVTAETVGDIRSAMGAANNVSITLYAGNGEHLKDSDLVVEGELYIIASKTDGSAKGKDILKSIDKGRVCLTAKGQKFFINGEQLSKAQMLSMFNAFWDRCGYQQLTM